MTQEPNTNPGSGEGEKPAREGAPLAKNETSSSAARKDAASSPRSSSAKSADFQPNRTVRTQHTSLRATLEDSYAEFSAGVRRLQGDTAKEYRHLLDSVAADVEKLRNDLLASDPTKAFVRDLTEAVEKGNAAAIAEAYATLLRHTVQRQATVEKRLLDVTTSYYEGVSNIAENAQKRFAADARGYSDSVGEALSESKLSELKSGDQALAAHALLIGAIGQSIAR